MLSEEKIKEYIEKDNPQCPYCNSENLYYDSIEIADNKAYQEISCIDCNNCWSDVYTLTTIREHK